MLRVTDLRVRFGSVQAVRGASFVLEPFSLTTLTGPNGAGKTSTLSAIAGVVPSTGGIALEGFGVEARAAHERAAAGIAFVPDGRRLFGRLTVEQNLLVGTVTLPRAEARPAIARILDRFGLFAERGRQRADTLSGGEAQLLMIARALVASPKVLLVDEPFQGLSAEATDLVMAALRDAATDGAAVLVATPEPLDGVEAIRIHHGSTMEVVA